MDTHAALASIPNTLERDERVGPVTSVRFSLPMTAWSKGRSGLHVNCDYEGLMSRSEMAQGRVRPSAASGEVETSG